MVWYIKSDDQAKEDRDSLFKLLELASAQYGRHFEWFHRHRDNALRQLAVLLTAEMVIARYSADAQLAPWVLAAVLISLAAMSPLLAHAGSDSCRRAFGAAMENTMFVSKAVWAILPHGVVGVTEADFDNESIPARDDLTFQVPRYAGDAAGCLTTQEFTDSHLGNKLPLFAKPRNTCFWAVVSIWTLGALGIIVGVAAAFSAMIRAVPMIEAVQ
jgi:hypothetical protein